MRTQTRLGTFVVGIGLVALLAAGCGEAEVVEPAGEGWQAVERSLEPTDNLPPEACGAAQALPPGADVVATARGTLVADFMEEDPQLRISSAGSTEYSCNCTGEGGGTCYPKLVGSDVVCVSMSCTACSLVTTSVSRFTALERATAACGTDYNEENERLVARRVSQVREWQARFRLPEMVYSRDHTNATAPEGTKLVAELVGTARVVYAAPERYFHPETGELIHAAGPANDSGQLLLQAAAGGKAKCFCDGSGSCSFTMDGVCAGTCGRSEGARGCVIKTRGVRNSDGRPAKINVRDPYKGR
jgi:hypothetical protein